MTAEQTHTLNSIGLVEAALAVACAAFGVYCLRFFRDRGAVRRNFASMSFVASAACAIAAVVAHWAWDYWQCLLLGLLVTSLGCLAWPYFKLGAIEKVLGDKPQ